MRIYLLLVFITLLSVLPAKADDAPQSNTIFFEYNEIQRSFQIFQPETAVDRLLIVLHPYGSSGRAMEIMTGLNTVAQERGFTVVYPDSQGFYWDDGRVAADVPSSDAPVDDLGFLTALSAYLSNEYNIDQENIYLAGQENGGLMVYTAVCHIPEQFAGFIVVGAHMWEYQVDQCDEDTTPANIFIINGQEDPLYTTEEQTLKYLLTGDEFNILGKVDTIDFWIQRNGCDVNDVQTFSADNLTLYTSCQEDTTVSYFAAAYHNQQWPRMQDNLINRFGADASQIIGAYITDDESWYELTHQEDIESGLARAYMLYVPSTYDPDTPTPLVMLLHGAYANPGSQAYASDFNAVAEREGIIAVYPAGVNFLWNYVRGLSLPAEVPQLNDEAFLTTVVDELSQDLNIDRTRMYITGLSNGGFMTSRLACTMQDQFAAFVSVGATGPIGMAQHCQNADPVPIMYIHGTEDTFVPWEGVVSESPDGKQRLQLAKSMSETIFFWATHNGCGSNITDEQLPQVDIETVTIRLTVDDCPDDAPVILYTVINGGHVWPGIHSEEYELTGEVTMDFNASEVIWEFFKQYSLSK